MQLEMMKCAAFELRTLLGGCGGGMCPADVIPRMLSLQVKVKTDGVRLDFSSMSHINTSPVSMKEDEIHLQRLCVRGVKSSCRKQRAQSYISTRIFCLPFLTFHSIQFSGM